MNEVKVLGKTEKGKELAIRIRKGSPLWEFCWTKGGEVPKELAGLWHEDVARTKANDFLNKKIKTKAEK